MANPKAIRDQIITILIAADPKNGSNISVKKWFKAEPPRSRWPGFPWGFVEATLGPQDPPVGTKAQIFDRFYVVVVDKHIDAEKADDSVLEFVDSVEAALDDDPSIGALVAFSWVTNREKQKSFIEGDYSMVAVRLTLATRRRE
jgi:hypothetical protein